MRSRRALAIEPIGDAVPREALGQARALRNALIQRDTLATIAVQRIVAPVRARTARNSIPRAETLTETARLWHEQLAGAGRLKLTSEQSKNRLAIHELRVSAADAILSSGDRMSVSPASP